MPWRGPAGATRPPHGGVYSASGNERAKPLAFPANRKRSCQAPISRNAAQATAPLHDAKPAGWCARAIVRQRPSGHERGKSASGSGRKRRPLRSAQRGTECVHQNSRSADPAPDRYPHGPGHQARFAPANRAGRPQGSARYATFNLDAGHPEGQSARGTTWLSHGFPGWRAFT